MVGISLLIFCIALSGYTESELLDEVLNEGEQEYIVVAVDANVRVNGDPDLWDPIPGVQVTIQITKAGGESHTETKTTEENGETGIVHASFNLYREQSIVFTAILVGNISVSASETLTWDTVENGANEVGMYSWGSIDYTRCRYLAVIIFSMLYPISFFKKIKDYK